MRAIRADAIGSPEVLRLVETRVPELAPDGVLIRTAYAGLIYADAEARRGTYYKPTVLPWWPGREVAGVVEAVGPEVTEYKSGDRVAALVLGGGCYAEFVQARTHPHQMPNGGRGIPSDIVMLPDSVSFSQALVYLVNFRLAHLAFHAWAKHEPDSPILVRGAAGGMGAMLLEIAAEAGAPRVAIVRGAEEAAFCRDLGADWVVDIAVEDEVAVLQRAGLLGKMQTAFNGVGGGTVAQDIGALAPLGQTIVYGYVAGKAPFDLFAVDKTVSVRTFNADNFLGRPAFAAATAALHKRFAAGRLVDVGSTFPLAEAAAAHALLERGGFRGKIALRA